MACNLSFRLAKGGNKDQLWFSLEKKSCTVANGGVRRKKKLYGGCNVSASKKKIREPALIP